VLRAFIVWLAHAVKDTTKQRLKQMARRFSFLLDRVRYAKSLRLGITLGVCMSGLRPMTQSACHLLSLGAIVQAWL